MYTEISTCMHNLDMCQIKQYTLSSMVQLGMLWPRLLCFDMLVLEISLGLPSVSCDTDGPFNVKM